MSAGPIIAGLLIVLIAVALWLEACYEAKYPPRLRDKEIRANRALYDYERIRSMGGWR